MAAPSNDGRRPEGLRAAPGPWERLLLASKSLDQLVDVVVDHLEIGLRALARPDLVRDVDHLGPCVLRDEPGMLWIVVGGGQDDFRADRLHVADERPEMTGRGLLPRQGLQR